jgi:hypothetical protein
MMNKFRPIPEGYVPKDEEYYRYCSSRALIVNFKSSVADPNDFYLDSNSDPQKNFFGYRFWGHIRTSFKSFLLIAKEQLMYSARRKKVLQYRQYMCFFSFKS